MTAIADNHLLQPPLNKKNISQILSRWVTENKAIVTTEMR